MTELINLERISLKNDPRINEDMIQRYLYENPSVLGLGDLVPIQREKIQTAGGRLDLLFMNDSGTRYEVEVQLGPTDPSHIIRTIEYWDNERKRNQQCDHCAVIVAEEITGRFMNVISLFNGHIPLIAIQLAAHKAENGNVSLTFTKIIDRITMDEDETEIEPTDRTYWEKRSSASKLKEVDKIFSDLSSLLEGYELKYNKFYIGTVKDGKVENVINFKPKKKFIKINVRGKDHGALLEKLEDAGLDASYDDRINMYELKIDSFDEYLKNRELITELVKKSIDYYNNSD